jgi:hypothetical protein
MNTMYVLVVCIGILWNGECGVIRKFSFPTIESCQAEQARATVKINDGYAYCTKMEPLK